MATVISEVVAFLLILFVLWKWVLPPVSTALKERQDKVAKQVEEAEEAKRRLGAAEDRFDEALAEARNEAAKIRDNARADGERIRAELREQAHAEVERIRQRGEDQLDNQREQLVRQLRSELGGHAISLAEELIRRELGDDDRKRSTVDEFLGKLDNMSDKGSRAEAGSTTGGAG
jgi:F-type H+-transporting ATPase subunit b